MRAATYEFFAQRTGSIEVLMADGTLETVHFVTPPLCAWLTDKAKVRELYTSSRRLPPPRLEPPPAAAAVRVSRPSREPP